MQLSLSLFLAACALSTPAFAYVTPFGLAPVNPLPVEFDNVVFSSQLTTAPFDGSITAGPLVREGRKGVIYVSASVTPEASSEAKCAYASFRSNGTLIKSGVIDPTGDFLIRGNCVTYGLARTLDGITFHVGTRGGDPFIARLTNDNRYVDYDMLVLSRDSLKSLLGKVTIVGASVATNPFTGDVYTAWNVKSGDNVRSWLIKYQRTKNSFTVFAPPIGAKNTQVKNVHVLPNGVIQVSGITSEQLRDPNLATIPGGGFFGLWYKDEQDGKASVPFESRVWPQNGAVDVSVSVDDDDYAVYFAVTFNPTIAKVKLFRLAPVIPRVNVQLPLQDITLDGQATSPVTTFPGSYAFLALKNGPGGNNAIYVTDTDFKSRSPIALPANVTGETFVSIAASRFHFGTINVASVTATNQLVLRKIGNKKTRVRIIHRKTGLAITMTLDGKIVLFPKDVTVKNQQFDWNRMAKRFTNVVFNLAITTRGRPAKFSTYNQERGYKLVGVTPNRNNRFQRFSWSKGRLVSLKDKKCVSLDRNFLNLGRWPGSLNGFPLITVPCSTDKMQVFDIVHAL
ncbi:hypothetical protein HDU96_006566 [Phlyctochytrium bullatum]|nr:hypothetical protein HDU96_006566 [Phlyctochytrium bullatum]